MDKWIELRRKIRNQNVPLRQLERDTGIGRQTLRKISKAGSELLFEVVSRAYERQSLIVTSNLPFESWTEVCGSERLTGAMLDRLTHKVHIIEANGQSYRLEQSRKRLARRKKTTE